MMSMDVGGNFSLTGLVQQLNTASQQIESLNKKYTKREEVAPEIQKLIPVLETCNRSIQEKKFTPDPELGEEASIDHLLEVLNVFPFSVMDRDISTRQKMATGMFAAFIKEVNELERKLKDLKKDIRKWRDLKKWKIGKNIEQSNKSNTNGQG